MKKTTKTLLIASLILIVLGGGLLIAGALSGGWEQLKNTDLTSGKEYQEKTIDYDEAFNKIEIDAESYPVKILKSDDARTHVKFRTDENHDVQFENDNGLLKISEQYEPKKKVNIDLGIWDELLGIDNEKIICLYLPEKEYGSITLNANAGDVEIDGLKIKNLTAELKAGSFDLKNISIESGEIKCEAGEVEIYDSILNNSNIYASVGSIDIEKSKLKNVNLEAKLGDIDVHDCEYDGGSMRVQLGSIDDEGTKYLAPVKKYSEVDDIDYEDDQDQVIHEDDGDNLEKV